MKGGKIRHQGAQLNIGAPAHLLTHTHAHTHISVCPVCPLREYLLLKKLDSSLTGLEVILISGEGIEEDRVLSLCVFVSVCSRIY